MVGITPPFSAISTLKVRAGLRDCYGACWSRAPGGAQPGSPCALP